MTKIVAGVNENTSTKLSSSDADIRFVNLREAEEPAAPHSKWLLCLLSFILKLT